MRTKVRQFRHRFRANVANKDVFRDAHHLVRSYLRRHGRIHGNTHLLAKSIDEQRRYAASSKDPVQLLTLLLLLTPKAAQAQQQIDKHPHGFHDKQARIYDLIDFNDAYVSTVLSLDSRHLPTFNKHLKVALDSVCSQTGTHGFSEEQFEAITRGLTREIAVYKTAVELGYNARMTSRYEDAMGVDIVIRDPRSERSVNLDIKSPSSYRYRLQDLLREGRMNESQHEEADVKGYSFGQNGHGREAVDVCLFRVDANELGEIVGFRFEEPTKLDARLQEVLKLGGRDSKW